MRVSFVRWCYVRAVAVLSEIWKYGPHLTGGREIRQLQRVYVTTAAAGVMVGITGVAESTPLNLLRY